MRGVHLVSGLVKPAFPVYKASAVLATAQWKRWVIHTKAESENIPKSKLCLLSLQNGLPLYCASTYFVFVTL